MQLMQTTQRTQTNQTALPRHQKFPFRRAPTSPFHHGRHRTHRHWRNRALILFCSCVFGVIFLWLVMACHSLLRSYLATNWREDTFCAITTPSEISGESGGYKSQIVPEVGEQVTGVIVEVMKKAGLPLVMHQFFVHMGPEAQLILWHTKENKDYIQDILHGQYDFELSPRSEEQIRRRYDYTGNHHPMEVFRTWSHSYRSILLAERYAAGNIRLVEFEKDAFGEFGEVPSRSHQSNNRDEFYDGTSWYNQLYTSEEFWNQFRTPFALTIQSDTLLCRPLTKEFLNHSYIGGLSSFKYDWRNFHPEMASSGPSEGDEGGGGGVDGAGPKFRTRPSIHRIHNFNPNPSPYSFVESHINGGLSLRNVEWARECLRQFGPIRNYLAEDAFFTYCHEKLNDVQRGEGEGGTIRSKPILESSAYEFSSDNGVTMCHNIPSEEKSLYNFMFGGVNRVCPVGVHKPWYFGNGRKTKKCKEYQELVNYCPEIAILEGLNFEFH